MQKIRTALLWEILNNDMHPSLQESDRTFEAMTPLVQTLFPGIGCRSLEEILYVVNNYVVPALAKRHPELLATPLESVKREAMTEIEEVLSCEGYEWMTGSDWRRSFEKNLEATSGVTATSVENTIRKK